MGGSRKKQKGSKDARNKILTLTKDGLIEIENMVMTTTEDKHTDMEMHYRTVLKGVQVGIQELKVQLSLIQVSIAQGS